MRNDTTILPLFAHLKVSYMVRTPFIWFPEDAENHALKNLLRKMTAKGLVQIESCFLPLLFYFTYFKLKGTDEHFWQSQRKPENALYNYIYMYMYNIRPNGYSGLELPTVSLNMAEAVTHISVWYFNQSCHHFMC